MLQITDRRISERTLLAASRTNVFSSPQTGFLPSDFIGQGGNNEADGRVIYIGPEGAIYKTGNTSSTDFPVTPGAYQTTLIERGDAFVNKTAFAFYNQVSLDLVKLL
ncbi:hypothetical protein LXJ15735_39220 [Lacrimispora xylanolytica]